jgi:transcriptional regulator with XRE-family HTH domain
MDCQFIESLKSYPLSYRLQRLRWAKNLTKAELARSLKCNARTIYIWEKGDKFPSGRMLERIRAFYELPFDFFVSDNIMALKASGNPRKRKES